MAAHRTPPHSDDAEQQVLGAMMKDPNIIDRVRPIVRDAKMFYHPPHRMIFHSILTMADRGDPVDITTVVNELDKRDQLRQSGGRVKLVQLLESLVTTGNVEAHAQIIKDKAVSRQLIESCEITIDRAYADSQPITDTLSAAEESIFRVSRAVGIADVHGMICDNLDPIRDEIALAEKGELGKSLLRTGFTDLDRILHIRKRGDLVVVGGRPSMGKTAFALNIAEHVALHQGAVGVLSLEMDKEMLTMRMLCGYARVPYARMMQGNLREDESEKLRKGLEYVAGLPIVTYDKFVGNAGELISVARRYKTQYDIQLLIVDYIQLMSSDASENRNLEIAAITRGMKECGRSLGIPIFCISQLGRAVEQRSNKRPLLSDLRDSGAIEQDADAVLFPFRPEYYDPLKKPGQAEIIIAKQRNGQTGSVWLAWDGERTKFSDLDIRHTEGL